MRLQLIEQRSDSATYFGSVRSQRNLLANMQVLRSSPIKAVTGLNTL
jgi:hypothetical protein